MTWYTVQAGYAGYFANTVTVEAENLDEALEKAIEVANEDPGWKSVGHCGPTYIDACYMDQDADPWDSDATRACPTTEFSAGLAPSRQASTPVASSPCSAETPPSLRSRLRRPRPSRKRKPHQRARQPARPESHLLPEPARLPVPARPAPRGPLADDQPAQCRAPSAALFPLMADRLAVPGPGSLERRAPAPPGRSISQPRHRRASDPILPPNKMD